MYQVALDTYCDAIVGWVPAAPFIFGEFLKRHVELPGADPAPWYDHFVLECLRRGIGRGQPGQRHEQEESTRSAWLAPRVFALLFSVRRPQNHLPGVGGSRLSNEVLSCDCAPPRARWWIPERALPAWTAEAALAYNDSE